MLKKCFALSTFLLSALASADYIAINLDADGTQSYIEYSSSQGDIFDFDEFSNDIRLNINGASYIVGGKDWFSAPATGTFDMNKVIDNEAINDNFYDDGAGWLEVVSYDISGTAGVDYEITFNFSSY